MPPRTRRDDRQTATPRCHRSHAKAPTDVRRDSETRLYQEPRDEGNGPVGVRIGRDHGRIAHRSPLACASGSVHNGRSLPVPTSLDRPADISGGLLVHRDVLAIVLAGGRGSRLEPLTRDRAKPAVPFGGIYRIIDFTLSNCINSDLRKILVLTQYKAVSLNRHIDQGWKFLCRELDEYIEVIPPQQRIAEHWYQGTADAIYQNVYTIEKAAPRDTLILAGDHIYKMNYAEMIDVPPRPAAPT